MTAGLLAEARAAVADYRLQAAPVYARLQLAVLLAILDKLDGAAVDAPAPEAAPAKPARRRSRKAG